MRLPNDWAARCFGPHRRGINKRQSACGADKVAYVRSLGADRVIDYKTEDIGRAIRDWSAEGVDVVLDVVGSTTLPHALDMLRAGGRVVILTADGDIERDRKEAEARGFRKITFIIDFERLDAGDHQFD